MAKKARKAAAKARKTKTSAKRKKRSAVKTRRKTAAPKRAKSLPNKSLAKKTKKKSAPKPSVTPRESFLQRVEDAVEAVLDTLTDAEHLHRKLEPDISREPE